MPIPLIVGALAAVAGAAGIGLGIKAGKDMYESNNTNKVTKSIQDACNKRFNQQNESTAAALDKLGQNELNAIKSLDKFRNLASRVKNVNMDTLPGHDYKLPPCSLNEIKDMSIAADVAIGALGGTACGTAGGLAASGLTTATIMTFGSASTGTAISGLTGAAATNATLAFLGGGSIAAGGGGVALGTAILGGATLGVGLLVGGAIFGIAGSKAKSDAEAALNQALQNEQKVKHVVAFLSKVAIASQEYNNALTKLNGVYNKQIKRMSTIINNAPHDSRGKVDGRQFSSYEMLVFKNLADIVSIQYQMCKNGLLVDNIEGVTGYEDNELPYRINRKANAKHIENVKSVIERTSEIERIA